MTFGEYREQAIKCAVYPNKGKNIGYPLLGLIGETGEVAEKIKKMIRDDDGILTDNRRAAIRKELGDVLWYTQAVSFEIGICPDVFFDEVPISSNTGFENVLFELNRNVSAVSEECRAVASSGEAIYGCILSILDCVSNLAELINTNLDTVAQENLDKLFDRLDRGVIKGDGDNR